MVYEFSDGVKQLNWHRPLNLVQMRIFLNETCITIYFYFHGLSNERNIHVLYAGLLKLSDPKIPKFI